MHRRHTSRNLWAIALFIAACLCLNTASRYGKGERFPPGRSDHSHKVFLSYVVRSNPARPVAADAGRDSVRSLESIFPASALPTCTFFVIVVVVLWVIYDAKRDRLSGFNTQQRNALALQNKSLAIWVLLLLLAACLYPLLKAIPHSQGLTQLFVGVYILVGIGIAVFIAVSSITSGASIITRDRWKRDYAKGDDAVVNGIGLLLYLGIAILILWLISTHGGR